MFVKNFNSRLLEIDTLVCALQVYLFIHNKQKHIN